MTVALGNNPGGSTLGGLLTAVVNPLTGIATFNGLTINNAGAGYSLVFSSGNLTTAATGAFTVAGMAATHLVVTNAGAPPAIVTAGSGSTNTFNITVSAEDAGGNLDPTYNGFVTLSLATNPGGSTLGGTLSVPAVAGVATFTGLTLNKLGIGYTFMATSGLLGSVTTSPGITVVAGPVSQFVVTAQPPASVVSNATIPLITLTAEDAAGNIVNSFTTPVTIQIGNNPGGATLGGTLTQTPINGVVTFTGLTLNLVGTGYTLTTAPLTVNGNLVTAGTTSAITVTPGALNKLAFTTLPPTTVGATSTFTVVVAGEDAAGNVLTASPDLTNAVTLTLSGGSGTLSGTNPVTPSGGLATFSNLSVNLAGTAYKLTAAASGLTSITTASTFTVTAQPATKLVTTTAPSSVAAGAGLTWKVSAEDANGNVDTNFTGLVTAAIGTNPGTSVLAGGLASITVTTVGSYSGTTASHGGHHRWRRRAATATATLGGGGVASITVTAPGSGYTYPPTISFLRRHRR